MFYSDFLLRIIKLKTELYLQQNRTANIGVHRVRAVKSRSEENGRISREKRRYVTLLGPKSVEREEIPKVMLARNAIIFNLNK